MFIIFKNNRYTMNGKLIRNGSEYEKVTHTMWDQVSIPSQRRYVAYWESLLSHSVPRGTGDGPGDVILPPSCSRELRRIRLYDTVNIDTIFFVISELHEVSSSQFMIQQCLGY